MKVSLSRSMHGHANELSRTCPTQSHLDIMERTTQPQKTRDLDARSKRLLCSLEICARQETALRKRVQVSLRCCILPHLQASVQFRSIEVVVRQEDARNLHGNGDSRFKALCGHLINWQPLTSCLSRYSWMILRASCRSGGRPASSRKTTIVSLKWSLRFV
jgi:hypothetical protein